jgi:amino acid transporter
VAEEAQEPSRNYPRALFGGLMIAGIVYLLVTVIASMAVPTDKLAGSDGPLLEVVQLGPLSVSTKIFSAIALFALANGALINMIMASRLVYGMASQGIVPRSLGRVHSERRTPWVAILVTTGLAILLISAGDLSTLADTTVILLLMVFVVVNVAVLVLRRDAVEHEHYRAPTLLPALGAVCCVALLINKAVEDISVYGYAAGLLALGAVLWGINRVVAGPHREMDPAKLVD